MSDLRILSARDVSKALPKAESRELINGTNPGRSSEAQITYFKSVGVTDQDAEAGRIALKNALAENLGISVPF